MLQLYIDDGVPNRGHRTNILSEKFKITGIASCEHSGFGGELVAVYAGSFKPNDLGRRELDKRAKN